MRGLWPLFLWGALGEASLPVGGEAIVISFRAPALLSPDPRGKVSYFLKKGEKVFIRLRNLSGERQLPQDQEGNEYYETLDPLGREAYIPSKFLKVIYQDEREGGQPLSLGASPGASPGPSPGPPLAGKRDPTDYRLYGPVDEFYPLVRRGGHEYVFAYGVGPGQQNSYPYPVGVTQEQDALQSSVMLGLLWGSEEGLLGRSYYGVQGAFGDHQKSFALGGDRRAFERRWQWGLGPWWAYHFFVRERFSLVFSGGVMANYHLAFIKQSFTGQEEERAFHGLSLASQSSLFFYWKDLFSLNMGPFVGLRAQFHLPYTLGPWDPPGIPDLWNLQRDSLEVSFGGVYAAFLGIRMIFPGGKIGLSRR